MTVNHAVATPMLATPRPVPMHRIAVLRTNSPSTVSARCAQVAEVPPTSTLENTDSTGMAIKAAISTATAVSAAPSPRRRWASPNRPAFTVCAMSITLSSLPTVIRLWRKL